MQRPSMSKTALAVKKIDFSIVIPAGFRYQIILGLSRKQT
jgi:hypothetical protein